MRSAVTCILGVLQDNTFDDVRHILAGIGRYRQLVELLPLDHIDGVGGALLEEPGHCLSEQGVAFIFETMNLHTNLEHFHGVLQATQPPDGFLHLFRGMEQDFPAPALRRDLGNFIQGNTLAHRLGEVEDVVQA